jgi:uncharacterized protein (DUF1330 family)
MTEQRSVLESIPRRQPVALIDLVRSPTHEAGVELPIRLKSVLGRNPGRLCWSGSIDHLLIGRLAEGFHHLLVSEYPSREACAAALAERATWQSVNVVSGIRTWLSAPVPRIGRFAVRLLMGANALRGGGPPPYDPANDPVPDLVEGMSGQGNLGPDSAGAAALLAADLERPVVMLNFLRHREIAAYAEPPAVPISGAAAYQRYGRNTMPLIGRLGGRIRWAGTRARTLVGDGEPSWHQIVLVQYPSRASFIGMLRSQAYRRGTPHRDAGLEATELVACSSHAEFA